LVRRDAVDSGILTPSADGASYRLAPERRATVVEVLANPADQAVQEREAEEHEDPPGAEAMETAAAEDLREGETDDQEHDDREDRPERTGQTRQAASGALGPLTGEALAPVRVRLLRPRVVAGDVAEARRHALRLRIPAAEAPGADVSPADVPAPEIGVGTLRTVIEIGR